MEKLLFIIQFSLITGKLHRSYYCYNNLKNYTRLLMSFEQRVDSGKCMLSTDFRDFKFANSKLNQLPIEQNRQNYVRRNIKSVIFSYVEPSPLVDPVLVAYSDDVLNNILDLDNTVTKDKDFIEFICGNKLLDSNINLAHRYGGHQFGYWASQLGDGRAITIGEYLNKKNERWELQLKGSGKTPYSRDGDGRAVLRSSIREFLCSESMHYLGIPTSRAATIVMGQNKVMRDLLYDGHPMMENTAVVLRLAPSWFRIGSLELLSKNNEIDLLKILLDFIIEEHFPDIKKDNDEKVIEFIRRVCRSTSDLLIAWQATGFTHGVLNTDNISLLGITIDYGPFGFMENYNLNYTPNHSDTDSKYSYAEQPEVMFMNLFLMVRSLTAVMSQRQIELSTKILETEIEYMNKKMELVFSQKLGFSEVDKELFKMFLSLLRETGADFTMSFRELSETPLADLDKPDTSLWSLKILSTADKYKDFIKLYRDKFIQTGLSDEERIKKMCSINPRYILRNWLAQEAIKLAEDGDFSEVNNLLEVLKNPFTKQNLGENKGYAKKPPEWAKNLRLSCSS